MTTVAQRVDPGSPSNPISRPEPPADVLRRTLERLYGDQAGVLLERVGQSLSCATEQRPDGLKALDRERVADPAWTRRSGETVYTFYVDRFAGTLEGVIDQLDYLASLGIRWLHPLPLLRARPGDSDGGFAVQDYREVEPALGDMATLERLASELRARGMGLLLDVVCNHTAREHDWAVRARAGDPVYRAYYHTVETAEGVAGWERTLIDVFPDTAPGSFTHDADLDAWVWTTFYPFQWDLNYANPDVFLEMLEVLLFLANRGVQGFRLDSAPFLWKRPGTSCRNQPETYAIIEAFRAALDIAAPGVVLLAEAIESLEDVLAFFGRDADGCDLAYNNGVMTALWGALADQDVGIVRAVLKAAAARPDQGAWLNYVRCHDDLIWNALAAYASPQDLARWSAFYDGGGFSSGRRFQTAAGGVPSTNGMAAALVGLQRADVDPSLALGRLILLYAVVHALDGWPLIYMGDEIALGNDEAYADDPLRRDEGRWLHRPMMRWGTAATAMSAATSEEGGAAAVVLTAMRTLGEGARALNGLGVSGRAEPVPLEPAQVLGFSRSGGRPFLCLANFADRAVVVDRPPGFDRPGLSVLELDPRSRRTGQSRAL
ncbi:alpha-amylase family glycosyl hydrolase [Brevundimonas sp. R86498]|uniref:alpha-amylase family glycosyl hydrolase n=1 Tax=Brevundimonas sp. R86498 TaxID=3093845 RepID=UPI0037C56A0C